MMPEVGTQTDQTTSTQLSEQLDDPAKRRVSETLTRAGSEPLRRGKRNRKKKYKSIRFYAVKRLRRSRKRRQKREEQQEKARKTVDAPLPEEDILMPPLEIAEDACPEMVSLREPEKRKAKAPERVGPSKPGTRPPMPMLNSEAPSESVEIKLETGTSAASKVKRELTLALNQTRGGRMVKQEHVDTGNVLKSLMPVRSERGMVRYYPDRPDPKRLSNRGKVIAPMGTMPNHIMMFRQLSQGQRPLKRQGDASIRPGAVATPIKKEN